MYLMDDVSQIIPDDNDLNGADERYARLRADLEQFVVGNYIDEKYLKKLHGFDSVWEIRSVRRRPGIRVFACFADTDVFIATNHALRQDLGGGRDFGFAQEARRCLVMWRQLFPTYEPLTGNHLQDCINNA